jgi:hypothetical protein
VGIGSGREGSIVNNACGPVSEPIERVGVDVGGGGPSVEEVSVGGRICRVRFEIGEDAADFRDRKNGFGFQFGERGFGGFRGKGVTIAGVGSLNIGEDGMELEAIVIRGRLRS